MPSATAVVGGWTVVVGIATAIWYLEKKKKQPAQTKPDRTQLPRKDPKPRRPRSEKHDSELNGAARDGTRLSSTTDGKSIPVAGNADKDDEVDNREFARQLTNAKAGTAMTAKSQGGIKQRSVKQSRAQNPARPVEASSDNHTSPSSLTGGDAEDDTSSTESADQQNQRTVSTFTNGISDMLAAPAVGPSILKVTEPTNPVPAKKANAVLVPTSIETKKQRQNRKKAELNRQANAEAEEERKRVLEKQRRTARQAEGRAAKDGSAFMASRGPAKSAWTAGPTDTTHNATTNKTALLDTFDASRGELGMSKQHDKQEHAQSKGDKWADLPSEEEQMRFSLEESQNWEIVKGKEKRKKTNKDSVQPGGPSTSAGVNSTSVGSALSSTSMSNSTTDDDQELQRGAQAAPYQARLGYISHADGAYKNLREKAVELVDSEWEVS